MARQRAVQKGFTLLEAIVALVIFASGAMALYSLYANNIAALVKAEETSRQVPLVRQAIERFAALNLSGEATGEFNIEDVRFTWTARPIEPHREGQNTAGLLGAFQLGLYQLDFTASDGERLLGRYRMRLVSHQLVRPANLDEF